MERWKPIDGCDNYAVSDRGRVWSFNRGGAFLRQSPDAYGYPMVPLTRNGKRITRVIHRLVLETFVGEPPSGMQAAHLDGNKNNNKLANLRWVTPKENASHRVKHGTFPLYEKHPSAKLTRENARFIRANYTPHSRTMGCRALAKMFGVGECAVEKIIAGKTWKNA